MNFDNPWLMLVLAGLVVAAVWIVSHSFSREARLERRRRRNNRRVEPRVSRPVVRLSVRTRSKRKKRS